MQYWTGISARFHHLRKVENVNTMEECMDLCLADLECNAVTYEPNDNRICCIKSGASSARVKSITTSAVKCNYMPKFNPDGQPDGIYKKGNFILFEQANLVYSCGI